MTAALIHTIRPDWPEAGIYRLLEPQLPHREATELIIALATAAANPHQTLPTADDSIDHYLNELEREFDDERQAG